MLLIVWLLSQTLGFILPSMSTVAKEEVLTWSSCDQNQLGNDGYDSGFLSCLVYDTEQPYGTTASLSDFVAIVQAAPAYDTAPVLTSRNTGSPRAQLYGRAQFFAAEGTAGGGRLLTQGSLVTDSSRLLSGVSGSANDIVVIGRQVDTAAADGWAGHKVLNIQNWSIPQNDAFIQAATQQRQTFCLASPINYQTLWNPGRNSMTVFGRELGQIFQSGYTQVGNHLVPPPLP